jgi:hypothetical protein
MERFRPGGLDIAIAWIRRSAIVPGIVDAIFAATGKRLRKMPVDASAPKEPA